MFVYKAMTALADVGGSVSFALPDAFAVIDGIVFLLLFVVWIILGRK